MKKIIASLFCIFLSTSDFYHLRAQITLGGTFTWVDPGETYQYTPGGASACPSQYLVSTPDGKNTTNNSGNSVGTGPFTYRWDNKSGGNFQITANNFGSACSSILPKIITNISHIYLQQLEEIAVPGGLPLHCGTAEITLSVPIPATSPSFNVTNPSENVQLIYTWNAPGWGINNVQTTTNQLPVTPSSSGTTSVSVSVKRNDAKVTTTSQRMITRALPTISSISQSLVKVCGTTSTISLSASGSYADKFIWTPSANVRINGNSTPQTITGTNANIGGIGDGTFSVKAYSTGCDLASTSTVSGEFILMSLPDISQLRWDYWNPVGTHYHQVSSYEYHYMTTYPLSGLTEIQWNPVWGPGIQQGSSSGDRFDFILLPYQTLSFSPLVLTNQCGSVSQIVSFQGIGPWLTVYPNPATDVLSIDIPSTYKNVDLSENIDIYSENTGKIVKSVSTKGIVNSKTQINVQDLPRGTYFLHFGNSEPRKSIQKTRIVLK